MLDRFFIHDSLIFHKIGYTEPPNLKVDPVEFQKEEKVPKGEARVLIGDNLGSDKYFSTLACFHFTSVPHLMDYGIKPFIFTELNFYPPYRSSDTLLQQFKNHTRGGAGFGLSFAIQQRFNFNIYYKLLAAHRKGDIIKGGYLNFELSFF